MALSMIVEMTSLTPRVTLSSPAMPAQRPPAAMATRSETTMLSGPGSHACPAKTAAANAATRYCPSTPMLKRFIRNPMATAIGREVVDGAGVDDRDELPGQRHLDQLAPHVGHGVAWRRRG